MGNNRSSNSQSFVARHKPSVLVLASQVSAAFIHALVKILETDVHPVDPLQILQVRLFITGCACTFYLWYTKAPGFPLGDRDLQSLLGLRALGGVCGSIGFYFSILYLTLAQATALNFLAPLGAMILSKYLDYATFGFVDQAGALIALVGVVLIVQPNTVFGLQDKSTLPENSSSHEMIHNTIKGVAYSAMGVLGGIEFLLTAGIASDTSITATVMIYSQVLWALALDRIVWHISIDILKLVGIGSVMSSLLAISLAKETASLRARVRVDYEAVPTCSHPGAGNEVDLEMLGRAEDFDEV
ncbi:hypothetical protein J7T55_015306 [Diaporthe amygdali]|uniref:uncharacterized protein n=1 Tax=Phomopsis amygdali TaxID=1214568 RepID=UPI0022FEB73F|nr:uncharacterized protein J7T55_015306 [Diaporthe amygdali]KAJ0120577.1 hypothetical protein J7T55_015306 [Diaporthe amygdali]